MQKQNYSERLPAFVCEGTNGLTKLEYAAIHILAAMGGNPGAIAMFEGQSDTAVETAVDLAKTLINKCDPPMNSKKDLQQQPSNDEDSSHQTFQLCKRTVRALKQPRGFVTPKLPSWGFQR